MKTRGNMSQTKEQGKSSENIHNEPETYNFPTKEFKRAIRKMFNKVRKTEYEQSKKFNRDRKYLKINKQKSWN